LGRTGAARGEANERQPSVEASAISGEEHASWSFFPFPAVKKLPV